MTIEITLRSGKKAVLDSASMTFRVGKDMFPILYWPIKTDENGEQWCDNTQVISWREIPNGHKAEQPAVVPQLPVLPSASVPDSGRTGGEGQLSQPGTSAVRVPSEPQVPSGGNLS